MAENKVFLNAVMFVLGFTVVFSVLGIALQTVFSGFSLGVIQSLRLVGGTIIIVFGLLMIASLKYDIPFFSREHKLKIKRTRNSYITSFVFGIAFALGWTPCVGAILGSIYTLAAVSPGLGFVLMLAYSLGIGLPFLIVGLFAGRMFDFLKKSQSVMKRVSLVSGLLLVVLGVLIVTNYIGLISIFLAGSGALSLEGQLSFFVAFVAGILTFFSPCILPLLPAFFSYITGTAASAERRKKS